MDTFARRAAIIGASVMVSFSAIFFRLSDSPPMVMVFYRMLFASAIIVPLAVWKDGRNLLRMDRYDLVMSVFSGIVFAVHLAAYFGSLEHISIASCLVLTDTAVFFVAFFMAVLFRERISARGWGIMALTFGGCVIIALGDSDLRGGLLGDSLALLSSVLFAVYAIIGRRVRGHVSTLSYTAVLYVSAAVTSLIIAAVSDAESLACGTNDLMMGLGLAVFCTILGHTVYNWGLKYEKAAFVAVTTLLEPVFGTLLGLIVFTEVPTAVVVVGSVIVLAGVYLFSVNSEPDPA